MTAATYGAMSDSEHSAQLRKAVIASTVGTTIEWYDFFLYSTVAGLIFAKLYFPNDDPLTARSPLSSFISSASSPGRSARRSSATTAIASAAKRR